MAPRSRLPIGVVVIGRNEGDRLRLCLESVRSTVEHVVYVDSGSTDGSVALAREFGVDVVELDLSQPFTAGRGRNAGFARFEQCGQQLEFVQFVDGDCEVVSGWLETALATLRERADVAIVFGRRRERFPNASTYNRLCDMEWNTAIGFADECGGDALVRASALREVDGYNPRVIAGEDSEMCVRLRTRGWSILRVAHEMTLHDAGIARFSQWWRRTVRSGYALAERAALHGTGPLRDCVGPRRSTLFWAGALPLVIAALGTQSVLASVLLLGYPVQMWRIYRYRRRHGDEANDARHYAWFTMLAKFAQLQGFCTYYWRRWRGKDSTIIEYKAESGTTGFSSNKLQDCA